MIIGLTGMPSAGKGTISDFLKEKGFESLVFSDVIREELRKRNLPIERKNLQEVANELRANLGSGILAKRLLEKVSPEKCYVLDGVRNVEEINELRKSEGFFLIAVDAPQMLRFKRELERGRENAPKTLEEFKKLDEKDYGKDNDASGQQVGRCMALADFSIYNDCDIGTFSERIKEILEEIKSRHD